MNLEHKASGGPAFPVDDRNNSPVINHMGMTLRDYFAAKAMQATVAATFAHVDDDNQWDCVEIAKHAYLIADAMLIERSR